MGGMGSPGAIKKTKSSGECGKRSKRYAQIMAQYRRARWHLGGGTPVGPIAKEIFRPAHARTRIQISRKHDRGDVTAKDL